ncbi:hypothetical protein [Streptomyces subrutilus]|uniref:Uncharacterized protein n=1 Tax=Streptomyces subrutilus TaxID=36818 RepID=A0A1E5NXX0_9ACTN|nr:hypothetical protein [Streptomyces subrutilus]OEJ21101.1 hypothetical protein BGK67_35000 [Streptomyces subrutilus]
MTRYGFAIKALPKPFETEDDEDEEPEDGKLNPPSDDPSEPADDALDSSPGSGPPTDPTKDVAEPPVDDAADPPADDAEAPAPAADDARPWAGDMYDEGDESDPANAYTAYTGSAGEEAWLDQAADGTLTGWVRDSTGQVWRYADPDAWAIDVDDAQMTRSHGGDDTADPSNDPAAGGPAKQAPLFPPQ